MSLEYTSTYDHASVRSRVSTLVLFACLGLAPACTATPESGREARRDDSEPSGTPMQSAATVGPEFVSPPPSGPVDPFVVAELRRAAEDDRQLLVYVGAHWCEPCTRFHEAVVAGELDSTLPRLRLIDFDLDEDSERLAAAGYSSRLIPLFVVPGAGGRGSERRMEGGVKGPTAVDNLSGRLTELLDLDGSR